LKGSIKTICRAGKYLLTGGYEEAIKIYDLRKKKEVGVLEDHKGTISVIRNFNNFIFSGSEDGTIKVWKTKDWALL
jgi:protein MAK11